MVRRLLAMECGRAFRNRWFISSVVLMVLMEFLSSSMMLTNKEFGVDEMLDNSVYACPFYGCLIQRICVCGGFVYIVCRAIVMHGVSVVRRYIGW